MPKFIKLTNLKASYLIDVNEIRSINISRDTISIYFKDNQEHQYRNIKETTTEIMEMINA